MSAALVAAYEGHKLVYLHLLCQGFENIGKALLLLHDYEKYGPMLRSVYGHDLSRLLDELRDLYGNNVLSSEASIELKSVSIFYRKHQLRYGDESDFNLDLSSLQTTELHSSLLKLLDAFNPQFV